MAHRTHHTICVSNQKDLHQPLFDHSVKMNVKDQRIVDYKPFFWCLDKSRLVWIFGERPVFSPVFADLIYRPDIIVDVREVEQDTTVNNLLSRLNPNETAEVYSTVHSKIIFELKNRLSNRASAGNQLPNPRPEEVAYINTRVGGYEWLSQIASLVPSLPETVTTFGIGQACTLIENQEPGSEWYVKSNIGVGGLGVWRATGGEEVELGYDALLSGDTKEKTKISTWMTAQEFLSQPYLVQKSVRSTEDCDCNSITADFFAIEGSSSEDSCDFLGFGFQIIEGDSTYAGVRFRSGKLPLQQVEAIRECGEIVAKALRKLGYVGFFNLDFVFSNDESHLYLLEINLRSSAPLDQFLFMRALLGKDWFLQDEIDFEFRECEPVSEKWSELWCELEAGRLIGPVPVHKPSKNSVTWPMYRFNKPIVVPESG